MLICSLGIALQIVSYESGELYHELGWGWSQGSFIHENNPYPTINTLTVGSSIKQVKHNFDELFGVLRSHNCSSL